MNNYDSIIRIAEETDFQGIMKLLRQLHPDDPIIDDGKDISVFNQILQDPNLHIFVCIAGGKIVSMCYLNIIPNLTRNASPYGVVENVITDPEMREKGYGKQIMLAALDYAWQADCYKVMLQSAVERENAHRFYEACGFNPNKALAFAVRRPSSNLTE